MNTPLEKLKKEAGSIRMSQVEKTAMHARITDAMRISVARTARPVQSTYFMYSWRMVGSFAMLVVIVLGTGTTYAAEGALPGSPLYPIKVGVNEPIKGALAFSNEAKIKFHTETAEVRLEEAETLAAEGRLTNEVSATLAANLTQHVERVQTIAKEIEAVDPVAAFEVTMQLDSSIAAHGEVLAHLGDKSKDEATRENSITIAYSSSRQNIGGSGDASGAVMMMKATVPAADIEVATFSATMATNAADQGTSSQTAEEKMTTQLEKRVEGKLQALRAQFNALHKSLATSTSLAVSARIDYFEERVAAGKQAKEAQDFELARAEYNSVFGGVIELSTFLTASKRFNKGILDALLKKYNFEVSGAVQGVMDVKVEAEAEKGSTTTETIKEEKRETEKKIEVEGPNGIRVDIGL